MGDLTTLANAKAWLGIVDVNAPRDVTLSRLIRAQSRFIENWLNRIIQSQPYMEVRSGSGAGEGRYAMTFANDPVSSVTNVMVNGSVVPVSPDSAVRQPGYGFDANAIWTSGYEFTRGRSNVLLNYVGGFLVLPLGQTSNSSWLLPAEQQVIPATPFQITTQNLWLSDNGVKFVSNGAPLVAVASAPAAGQYTAVAGLYTFNTADQGKTVAISYSYVPADIEQACIDLISLSWKMRDRIGLVSQSVGTESVTLYVQKAMPDWAATTLLSYQRTFVL